MAAFTSIALGIAAAGAVAGGVGAVQSANAAEQANDDAKKEQERQKNEMAKKKAEIDRDNKNQDAVSKAGDKRDASLNKQKKRKAAKAASTTPGVGDTVSTGPADSTAAMPNTLGGSAGGKNVLGL